ncbi:MAG: TSUP family transporter, partial [[Eubacterium] siraeum]|nr:TSUP family transporter [[Eubacterium] siraeum]
KRGWIMLACIVSMCVAGSIAAWSVGNVVLGSFTLFLTFCIGIRFLIKPDTSRKEAAAKGSGLDAKGIAVSLFFGLTIGFGTGFVGSGGGMMMLVVFTAFLGMERKAAVGTSTFIMTFTALIASVSHIAVDPTILFERWNVLLICIVVATAASVVSARFANKVNNRVVGLVTGAVLTVLGAFMLILNYWEYISQVQIIADVLICLGKYLLYLLCFVALLLILRFLFKIPKALWRKLLHLVAYTSIVFMILVSENWLVPAICCILFAAVVYPILHITEKWNGFNDLFVQKAKGEVKKSLLLLFLTHAALIAVCWGALGKPYIAAAAIIVWGIGDTVAALIGIKFGRHNVKLPLADKKKTWEGTAAMAVTDLLVCFALLILISDLSVWRCVLFSLVIAPLSAYVELISHNGNDTVSVPVSVAAALALLTLL